MRIMKKNSKAYKTIGEVAEILELDSIGNKKNTHTIRYWESEFIEIKPELINIYLGSKFGFFFCILINLL